MTQSPIVNDAAARARLSPAAVRAFLSLASIVILVALYEWSRLVRGSRAPDLRESAPVLRPLDPHVPASALGAVAIAVGLARHLTDQDTIDHAAATAVSASAPACGPRVLIDVPEVREAVSDEARAQAYVAAAEKRFDGINHCC